MTIQIACPRCATLHRYADSKRGQEQHCRRCDTPFAVCDELSIRVESPWRWRRTLRWLAVAAVGVGLVAAGAALWRQYDKGEARQ